MNQLATRETGQIVQADSTSLMEVISRAASDPNTDVDKLERMLGMYERISARQAETHYDEAMSAAQAAMRPIAADASNPQTKSKYASYAALDRVVRPIYVEHGFSLSFYQGEGAPADCVRVACKVAHRDGHSERPHLDMPADGKGAKGGDVMTKTHATGAAFSYGQRYLLKMIFNIAVGEDDDGNSASGPKEMGDAARHAISEINACETPGDLAVWKKNKAGGLQNILPAGEMKEVIGTYNRRVEAMKTRSDDHGA